MTLACLFALLLLETRVHTPPPTLDDFLSADVIVTGTFELDDDGLVQFHPGDFLIGEDRDLLGIEGARGLNTKGGKVIATVRRSDRTGITWNNYLETDATVNRLWFWHRESRNLDHRPARFIGAFRALLDRKQPELLFRLLVTVDGDMRRAAYEELYAHADPEVVKELHRLVTENDELAPSALIALDATGLYEASEELDDWIPRIRRWGAPTEMWIFVPPPCLDQQILHFLRGGRFSDSNLTESRKLKPRTEYLDTILTMVDNDDAAVRLAGVRILGKYRRAASRGKLPERIGERVLVVLEDLMGQEKDAEVVKAIVHARSNVVTPEPPTVLPPWTKGDEYRHLLQQAGSRLMPMERSAGELIVANHLDELIKDIPRILDFHHLDNYDPALRALGFIRHPEVERLFLENARKSKIPRGHHRTVLSVVARLQGDPGIETILELAERSSMRDPAVIDALGHIKDPRALAQLEAMEDGLEGHLSKIVMRAAKVRHGVESAIEKEIASYRRQRDEKHLPVIERWVRDGALSDLIHIETTEITELMQQDIREMWPMKAGSAYELPRPSRDSFNRRLLQFGGQGPRTNAMAEVARRTPRWLGDLCVEMMKSEMITARREGRRVFLHLTGHGDEFDPDAFARERAPQWAKVQSWWLANREKGRSAWVLERLRSKGLQLDSLKSESAPRELVKALDLDPITRGLAIEAMSRLTGRDFEVTLYTRRYEAISGGIDRRVSPEQRVDHRIRSILGE